MLSAAVWRITPTFVQKSPSFYCNASTYLVHALRYFILSPFWELSSRFQFVALSSLQLRGMVVRSISESNYTRCD